MAGLGTPANSETAEMSSMLNAFILFTFLMGMYTLIYFGTIYMYYTKNSSKHHPVPAALTMLYLSAIAIMALEWHLTKRAFVDDGDTRQSVFLTLIDSPNWTIIALNASNCITFLIADGLLIWRCFFVWNCSWPIISVSLFLIVTEFTLFLVEISFNARYNNVNVTPALARKLDAVLSAALFMSFATTLVTTVLIAYRIYSVSKREGTSSRRFKHIVDIVIQSGALYALSQFTTGLSGVVTGKHTSIVGFEAYAQLLNVAIAGISPTVVVARVALLSNDTTYPSTSIHLSGLQFHTCSTNPTVNMEAMENAHFVDGDRSSATEGQSVEKKV